MITKNAFPSIVAMSALLMATTNRPANAQYANNSTGNGGVVSTPYGNLPANARPVNLSPSAPYTTNPYNTFTQGYDVFNTNAAGNVVAPLPFGYGYYNSYPNTFPGFSGFYNAYGAQPYGVPGYFGIDPSAGYGTNGYFTNPFGGYVGNNITVVGGGYPTGIATVGPNGVRFGTDNSGFLTQNGTPINPYGRAANSSASGGNGRNAMVPDSDGPYSGTFPTLAQQVSEQRGKNFDVNVAWRGNPQQIENMKVTLLNAYRVPIATQIVTGQRAAYFAPSTQTSAARYYQIDVLYANGATASMVKPIR